METINLSNKKILVTGASSGQGRDIAEYLSECGAEIILVGRNQARLKETLSAMNNKGKHRYICCDLAKESDLTDLFSEAVQDGKKLDGMVHCAGIIPLSPISTINREAIEECMSINFYALLELVRCFSRRKFREDKTSIVEVSSICSQYPGKCQTLYAASKAAANASVQSLAMELFDKGVRINSVLPGTINTPAIEEVTGRIGKEAFDALLRPQIHGLIEMREISSIIAFLLSGLSTAITGRTVYADGGYIRF